MSTPDAAAEVHQDPSEGQAEAETQSWISWFIAELTGSPINLCLLIAIIFLLYKILKSDPESSPSAPAKPPIPPMKKQDFMLKELRQYDGTNEEGRVCVAVNGKVYDVTKGSRFYGPGGPYSGFAGRDASRGLATFSVEPVSDDYDDLSDLKPSEMDQIKEWELQFSERYTLVGKLLRPGEEATRYSEEEDDDDDDDDQASDQPAASGDSKKKD